MMEYRANYEKKETGEISLIRENEEPFQTEEIIFLKNHIQKGYNLIIIEKIGRKQKATVIDCDE